MFSVFLADSLDSLALSSWWLFVVSTSFLGFVLILVLLTFFLCNFDGYLELFFFSSCRFRSIFCSSLFCTDPCLVSGFNRVLISFHWSSYVTCGNIVPLLRDVLWFSHGFDLRSQRNLVNYLFHGDSTKYSLLFHPAPLVTSPYGSSDLFGTLVSGSLVQGAMSMISIWYSKSGKWSGSRIMTITTSYDLFRFLSACWVAHNVGDVHSRILESCAFAFPSFSWTSIEAKPPSDSW